MSKSLVAILAVGIIAVGTAAGLWVGGWFGGSGPMREEIVYFCLETKEVVRGAPQPLPAVNPKTGRRTLVRGMRDEKTGAWGAAPPDEVLRQRQARGQGELPRMLGGSP